MDVSQVWKRNHPWAPVYAAIAGRGVVGPILWRVGLNTDLRMLHRLAARELSALEDGDAVLDVPCGGGVALRGVGSRRLRYVCGDIAPAMLDRARAEAERREVPGVEYVEADAMALPFAEAEFDLALSFTSLHCYPDPEAAVAELGRVVKPGGRVAGSAFLTDGGMRYELALRGGRLAGLMGPSGSTKELRAWLADAGFERVVIERSGALVYFRGTRG